MSTPSDNSTVVPSIDAVNLTYKQIFPTEGVSKNVITFDREEDMITMCLSAFVHDYVHDYNLGSMHARVIKGNVARSDPDTPSLFETLGITVGNTIVKIISYPVGGHRDVSMYNDEQFEDEQTNNSKKNEFYKYLDSNEEPITLSGGRSEPYQANELLSYNKADLTANAPEISTNISMKGDVEAVPDLAEEAVPDLVPEVAVDAAVDDVAEGVEETVKKIVFNDLKELLVIPSVVETLNMDTIVSAIEKNADFLDFHSALNTYVVTYLGYNENELTTVGNKNSIANEAIRASFNYIISDLKTNDYSIYVSLFADMFSLLLDAYEVVMKNKDANPFDILNSPEMLYQFIIFYVSYVSVENYDAFKQIISSQKGGQEVEGEGEEIVMEEISQKGSPESSVETSVSPFLPQPMKESIDIPEYVIVTHNNLLTTITRGMFIKLGIWKRIFFPDTNPNPEDYIFGFEQLNQISYDKLVEIFPINPELGGHRNNELLILEILILKRLLVEMSPSKTLTFGAKIDDDLKNYMDTFYYDYFIKDTNQDYSEIDVDDSVMDNPTFDNENMTEEEKRQMDNDAEELFAMCEEDCEDLGMDFSADSKMEGGMHPDDYKYLVEARKLQREQNKLNEPVSSVEPNNLTEISPAVEPNNLTEVSPTKEPNNLTDIIQPPRPQPMPILFNKLKKMYQNNMHTIKHLQNSKIQPIEKDGLTITNLYQLLQLNETLMHKKGTKLNIPAPKYKFVINNAANVGSNINGTRMFIPRSFLEAIKTIVDDIKNNVFDGDTLNETKLTNYTSEATKELDRLYTELKNNFEGIVKDLNAKKRKKTITIAEYNNLLAKKSEQKTFERTNIVPLENKLFLLEVLKEKPDFYSDFVQNYSIWFKDSQPIFGLYRSLQRGIFCPTTSMMDAMDNCSLKYKTTEPKEVGTSYSEIVYEKDGKKISFGGVVLNYNTVVNGNEELTAKIHYNLVCNLGQSNDIMTISTLPIKVSESNDLKARVAYRGVINKIKEVYDTTDVDEENTGLNYLKEMWKRVQYQYDQSGFNMLLSATALKTMGDYLQECQACFKWGGYVSNTNAFPPEVKDSKQFKKIKNKLIYRSVDKSGVIIPYDKTTGNALRLGIQGDRPSGFRSIYMLMNGEGDVNDQSITGYAFTSSTQNPSRTLLVARNLGQQNSNGLKGSVIYVTRELQMPDKNGLLRSLEYLNIKDKARKVEGTVVSLELKDPTIIGSEPISGEELLKNPMTKLQPLKNSAYEAQLDYDDVNFVPNQPAVEVEHEKTDAEEARDQRKNQFNKLKGLDPSAKALKKADSEKLKLEKQAEAARKKAEKEEKQLQINEAKRKINNARSDLSEKQKNAKMIQKIPVSFLTTINPQDLGIDQNIYNIILDEAQENERITQLAQEQLLKDKEERERKKREKMEYESSPEGIAEREAAEVAEQQAEENRRAQELADQETKKQAEEARKIQISQDIEKLKTELSSATDTKTKTKLNKQIFALETELRGLNKRRGGGTLTNKKMYKHKFTKKLNKNAKKLTKKHKKTKLHRHTRKIKSE